MRVWRQVCKSDFRAVGDSGQHEQVQFSIDEVRTRLYERGLTIQDPAVATALAVLEAGHHVALVATSVPTETVTSLAELLADCAARQRRCVGWINFHLAASGLVRLDDLLAPAFVLQVWLVLIEPSPTAISRAVDDVRRLWKDTDARLVVATSSGTMQEARLSPAGRRALVSVQI
jgi:hypothetical protein